MAALVEQEGAEAKASIDGEGDSRWKLVLDLFSKSMNCRQITVLFLVGIENNRRM